MTQITSVLDRLSRGEIPAPGERQKAVTMSPTARANMRALLRKLSDERLRTIARGDDEAGRMARRILIGRRGARR